MDNFFVVLSSSFSAFDDLIFGDFSVPFSSFSTYLGLGFRAEVVFYIEICIHVVLLMMKIAHKKKFSI
jgi:hypothetical protein